MVWLEDKKQRSKKTHRKVDEWYREWLDQHQRAYEGNERQTKQLEHRDLRE